MTRTREERRLIEASYPKCGCGNTLGVAAVMLGGKKCKRCVDMEVLAKKTLYGCRECGACGVVGTEFTLDTFGGDIDIQCNACGSSRAGLVALVIADLVARLKAMVTP